MMHSLIANVATASSAETAGLVGVMMALVGLVRVLIERRAKNNGTAPPTKDEIERIVVAAVAPRETEIIERNTTRDRIAELHKMACDSSEHQKKMLLTTHDMVRYTKESAQNTAAILASINQTNAQNHRAWLAQDRTLEHILQVDERTKRIEDKLTH